MMAPYDWRLSPSLLEERDGYFSKLKVPSTYATCRLCCHPPMLPHVPPSETHCPVPATGLPTISQPTSQSVGTKICCNPLKALSSTLQTLTLCFVQVGIEILVKRNKQKAVILAHSLGGTHAIYFIQWVGAQEGGTKWLSDNVHAMTGIGAAFLGAPKTLAVSRTSPDCRIRPVSLPLTLSHSLSLTLRFLLLIL